MTNALLFGTNPDTCRLVIQVRMEKVCDKNIEIGFQRAVLTSISELWWHDCTMIRGMNSVYLGQAKTQKTSS